MNKAELRQKLTEKGITFHEDDPVAELKKKLEASEQTVVLEPEVVKEPTADERKIAKFEPHEIFSLMDEEDELAIMSEIKGEVLKTYVYSFEQDGKKVVGMSKAGVDNISRDMADRGEMLRIITVTEADDGEYFRVRIEAGRYVNIKDKDGAFIREQLLETKTAGTRQWKKMKLKSGAIINDNFWYQKAIGKAQRNVFKMLMPYKMIEETMKKYLGESTGEHVKTVRGDERITENAMRYIHKLGADNNLDHKKIKAIVKAEWGYDHVTQLLMNDVTRLCELIRDNAEDVKDAPQAPVKSLKIPFDVVGKFNEKGFTPARREAVWAAKLQEHGNDTEKAAAEIKELLDKGVLL